MTDPIGPLLPLTLFVMSTIALFAPAASPSFAEPTTPTDPALQHTIEQVVAQYIRTHQEVVEQSLQALEAKREAEEKARVKQAIVTRQNDLLNDPSSPVRGKSKGDVTVGGYFDIRCGYCKRADGAVMQLQSDDLRVRVVYKEYPSLGACPTLMKESHDLDC